MALHPHNKHIEGYDFDALTKSCPELTKFVTPNRYGNLSIDFSDPKSVRTLNRALLIHHYGLEYWDIPPQALTPPIPGRADYIHHLADLIGQKSGLRCLDIGVGANCIYPIIGVCDYSWEFVGSDIEPRSIESAQRIVERNKRLKGHIELRHQSNDKAIFNGIISPDERFDATLCNPPFHTSAESAQRGTQRKIRNLKGSKMQLNFAGASNELWCEGGERLFVTRMIEESSAYRNQCRWFTTLISNEDNLRPLRKELQRAKVKEHRTIEMAQGNKRSRILAWRY